MAHALCGRILTRSFLKKRRNVCLAEIEHSTLERTMSTFDLICIGIGGTVGSGVFVLTGIIARQYAGPGVVLSWLIAGIGCCFSAMSYAELSARIPSAGSSYAYVYCGLGEFPAVIAAWCLSLEYGISGSAVARSWGDKVNSYVTSQIQNGIPTETPTHVFWPLDPNNGLNLAAGLLQLGAVCVLLAGVDIGKMTVNFFTIVKMLLVLYMIIGGLMLFDSRNVEMGWMPMGYSGVLRGATSCFFGYIGYDEVCCMAAEAKDPHRSLPRAGMNAINTFCQCTLSIYTPLTHTLPILYCFYFHFSKHKNRSSSPPSYLFLNRLHNLITLLCSIWHNWNCHDLLLLCFISIGRNAKLY